MDYKRHEKHYQHKKRKRDIGGGPKGERGPGFYKRIPMHTCIESEENGKEKAHGSRPPFMRTIVAGSGLVCFCSVSISFLIPITGMY
jgi:hypothetical protein